MKKVAKIVIMITVVFILAVLSLMWIYTDNKNIEVTNYQITNKKIPVEFNGFRIAQVSDLHNADFGDDNANLLSLLSANQPDIIVFTGDQIDARRTNLPAFLDFARQAVEIAPCYLVHGNHEGSITEIFTLISELKNIGVTILDGDILELEHNGAVIDLLGLSDPTLSRDYLTLGFWGTLKAALEEIPRNPDRYSILLAHQPEYINLYSKYDVDLALCGHVHGGQIRLGDRGVIGPSKQLFPEYDAGIYTRDDTTMVVSRGLGNSLFPWRVNNPPELVMVELYAE